jgi:hypothetical protein
MHADPFLYCDLLITRRERERERGEERRGEKHYDP